MSQGLLSPDSTVARDNEGAVPDPGSMGSSGVSWSLPEPHPASTAAANAIQRLEHDKRFMSICTDVISSRFMPADQLGKR